MQRIAKNPDDVFPKVFPAVADAANSEDSGAKEILFTAAIGLGNLAHGCCTTPFGTEGPGISACEMRRSIWA